CSLISSAMRFSFRRDNTKSSKVGGPLELLMIRTNACTLLRASSALASSKSKNLSPLPNSCCRENIESGYSAVNDLFSQTVKLAAASGSTGINGTGAGDRVRGTGDDGPVRRGTK